MEATDPIDLVPGHTPTRPRLGKAEDAAPLVTPAQSAGASGFSDPPVITSLAGLGDVLTGLGDAFARAASKVWSLPVSRTPGLTVYLGSSTGLRLHHVEPTRKAPGVARSDGPRRRPGRRFEPRIWPLSTSRS